MIAGISFDFNRKESDLSCFSYSELKEQVANNNLFNIIILETTEKSITQSLTEINQGKKLWKLCVILALLFLAIEVLLLRFMK